MNEPRLTPRQIALNAILESKRARSVSRVSEDTWALLVNYSWDSRAKVGDRREIRRSILQLIKRSNSTGDAK